MQRQLFRSTMASIYWVTSSRPPGDQEPGKRYIDTFLCRTLYKTNIFVHQYFILIHTGPSFLALLFFTSAGHLVAKGTVRFIWIMRRRLNVAKRTVGHHNFFFTNEWINRIHLTVAKRTIGYKNFCKWSASSGWAGLLQRGRTGTNFFCK